MKDKFRANPFAMKYKETLRKRHEARTQALKGKMKVGKGKSHITGNIYNHDE